MNQANARLIGFLSKAVSRIENKQREHVTDKIYDTESDILICHTLFSSDAFCTCFMTPLNASTAMRYR